MNAIVPVNPQSDNPFQFFNFKDFTVRIILNDEGEPLFIAADVCKVLDIDQVSRAMERLDDDEKGVISNNTPGGKQEMWAVNEPGLYTLVLGSRKPAAKEFKRWIAHEVIPSIRKTGGYVVKPMSPAEILVMHAQNFLAHEQRLEAIEKKQARISAHVDARNEHFTVLAYCRLKGLNTPTMADAGSIGKRCVSLSNARGYEVGRVSDPRYGWVNTYHESILNEVMGE